MFIFSSSVELFSSLTSEKSVTTVPPMMPEKPMEPYPINETNVEAEPPLDPIMIKSDGDELFQEDANNEYPTRPDKRLTKAQIIQFLKEADDSDRYFLVRKVIAMLAYLGALKLSMLRKMTLGSVKPHPKGYAVYIDPDMSMSSSNSQMGEIVL